MFDELETDRLTLIKANGTTVTDIAASVQGRKVFTSRGDLQIEHGDLLIRHRSNGTEEHYRVLDADFSEAFIDIPASYTLEVEKVGAPAPRSRPQSVTYNVSGPNARINHHSVDQSTNVVGDNAVVHDRIADLRRAVEDAGLADSDRQEALDVVNHIESQCGSGTPKRSVVKAMLAGLPAVGDIAKFGVALLDVLS